MGVWGGGVPGDGRGPEGLGGGGLVPWGGGPGGGEGVVVVGFGV